MDFIFFGKILNILTDVWTNSISQLVITAVGEEGYTLC